MGPHPHGQEARALYRWIKGESPARQPAVWTEGGLAASPGEVAKRAAEAWAKLWAPEERVEGAGWVWRPPEGPRLPAITERALYKAVRATCGNTAGGPDGWKADEMRSLPRFLIGKLAALLNLVEATGRWPEAVRNGTVALLPKEGGREVGQERPITILPLVYRVWAKVRRMVVRRWAEADPEAAEVHGRGALAAAWDLAIDLEEDRAEGRHSAAVYLDCSK